MLGGAREGRPRLAAFWLEAHILGLPPVAASVPGASGASIGTSPAANDGTSPAPGRWAARKTPRAARQGIGDVTRRRSTMSGCGHGRLTDERRPWLGHVRVQVQLPARARWLRPGPCNCLRLWPFGCDTKHCVFFY